MSNINNDSRNENLKSFRNFLNMTQTEFIKCFLTDENGKSLVSLATYSNLENGWGVRLDCVIENVSEKFHIDKETFTMDRLEFIEYIEENFREHPLCELNNKNKDSNISSLVNILTDYFANQMIAGSLSVGEQVESDRDLAKKLKTSRSSIREALKVLQIMGMIDIRPGQGTYIASQSSGFFSIPLSWALFLNVDEVENIIQVRSSLELKAVELASKSTDSDTLAKLTEVFNESTKALQEENLEKFLEEDIKFHLVVAECSGNPLIFSLLSTIQNLLKQISSTGLSTMEDAREIYREHQDIYGAILLNDIEKAKEAMFKHSEQSKHRYKVK